MYDDE